MEEMLRARYVRKGCTLPSLDSRQPSCISTNQRLIKSSLRVFIELNLLPSPQHHSTSLRSVDGAVSSNLLITWSRVTGPTQSKAI